MELFWRQGYEGTSVADLTKVMGINPPSLYAAFGNKEGLFREAVDRYVERSGACIGSDLAAATARAAVEKLLRGTAERLTDPNTPNTCMLVSGALSCSEAAEDIRQELTARRGGLSSALEARFKQARTDGELSDNTDIAALARYFATVCHGMSVQAAGGASRNDLMQVAEMALKAFPADEKTRA
jgi:AcrR family transcriptional regulator